MNEDIFTRIILLIGEDGHKYGPIGLTPTASADIADISAEFSEGVNAYLTQNYKLALVRLKPFAEIGNASGIAVQAVYLGTCTGGRASDFHQALAVLRQ